MPDLNVAPAPREPRRITAAELMARPPELPGDWARLDAQGKNARLLSMAASSSYLRFVRAMLASGEVDVNTVRTSDPVTHANGVTSVPVFPGSTPLLMALTTRAYANVRPLLDAGANPRAVRHDGKNVWDLLLTNVGDLPDDDLSDLVGALIDAGGDVNQINQGGRPALLLAYLNRRYTVVDPLLAAGADPHLTSENGRTALHDLMFFHDRWNVAPALRELDRLLALGLDPNASTTADPERSLPGVAPLDVVPELDEVAVALIDRGGRFNRSLHGVVHGTMRIGRLDLLDALGPLGLDDPEVLLDLDGNTPLATLVASMKGDRPHAREPVALLNAYLERFPRSDLLTLNNYGHGLLYHAAYLGQAGVVARLLELGVPAKRRDHGSDTPLVALAKGTFSGVCADHLFNAGLTPYDEGVPELIGTLNTGERIIARYVAWESVRLREATDHEAAPGVDGPRARRRI